MGDLAELLDQLEAAAGPADPLPSADGWELVLAENIAYLVDDRRRWQVPALQRASQLLRRHGRATCTRTSPACPRCPIAAQCPSDGHPPPLY